MGERAEVNLEQLLKTMASKAWEVFIGKPPKDADRTALLGYFSRYVYRTAITNQRLLTVEQGQVTFTFFNNQECNEAGQGVKRKMSLSAIEFIRRFLRHVLPFGYHRVRHFGLYAGSKARLLMVQML